MRFWVAFLRGRELTGRRLRVVVLAREEVDDEDDRVIESIVMIEVPLISGKMIKNEISIGRNYTRVENPESGRRRFADPAKR